MSDFLKKIKLNHNIAPKVISLLLAIALWIFVMDTENPVMNRVVKNIDIKVQNLALLKDKNLEIISMSAKTVNIEIRGRRSDIFSIKPDDIKVRIDASSLTYGQNNLLLRIEPLKNDVIVSSTNIEFVNISVDEILTKSFTVQEKLVNELSPNLSIDSISPSINEVSLKGPKRYMDTVNSVFAPIDLSKIDKSLKLKSKILVVDDKGREINELNADNNMQIYDIVLKMTKIFNPSYKLIGKYKDYIVAQTPYIKPDTLVLEGDPSQLSTYNPNVEFVVDVSDIDSNYEQELSFELPQQVSIVGKVPKLIIPITKYINKEYKIPVDNIEFIGKEDNTQISLGDIETIDFTLYAEEEVLDKLSSNDIKISMVLKDYNIGKYNLSANINLPNNIKNVKLVDKETGARSDILQISNLEVTISKKD